MDQPPRLLFGTLQFDKRCGAKTRSGAPCQNAPMQLGGRCRMHGGASLRGPEHPRYKHGKYSKYRVLSVEELIAKYATMPPVEIDLSGMDEIRAELARLAALPFEFPDLVLEAGQQESVL